MNKRLMAITAASALAAAAPAAAQYGSGYYPPTQPTPYPAQTSAADRIDARIGMLQTRINAGVRQGTINWREAEPLHQEMYRLSRIERDYSVNGLTADERQDLRERIRAVRQQVRAADGGAYDRYERVDQYGYYADPYYGAPGGYRSAGQGGPYEPVEACERRAGIGGIIANVLGVGDDCGLGVGERAPANLYAVPYPYQSQYRDGNGYYYRYDGQQIYAIDARTGIVAQVYPVN